MNGSRTYNCNDCVLPADNSSNKLFDLPTGFIHFFVFTNVAVLVLTVFGNFAVIYVFMASDAMRNTVNNHFLVSLSVADILVGLLVMPCALDALCWNKWRCGGFWKDFSGFGNFCFCISSIMHLMMLSVDRFLAISKPLHYSAKMTTNRAWIIVVILWTYSILWALPPLFGLSSYECFIAYIGKCHEDDWTKYGLNLVFGLSVVSCTYGLALGTMIVVYWKIGQTVRQQAQRIDNENAVPKLEYMKNKVITKKNLLARNKGVVTLLIVILAYLVCWSPFCVLLIIELAQGKKVKGPASVLTMFIGFFNSCCNPIIYSVKYKHFRSVLKRLVRRNVVAQMPVFYIKEVPNIGKHSTSCNMGNLVSVTECNPREGIKTLKPLDHHPS